jgi:hypothetical protein
MRTDGAMWDFLTREKLAKEFAELASKIEDPTRRDAFIGEAAASVDLPESRLRGLMASSGIGSAPPRPAKREPDFILREEEFLRVLMEDPRYIEQAREQVRPEDFEQAIHRRMYERLLAATAEGRRILAPTDLNAPSDEQAAWARILTQSLSEAVAERIFTDVIARFEERRRKARVAEIKRAMAQAERAGNKDEVERLLTEFTTLTRYPAPVPSTADTEET